MRAVIQAGLPGEVVCCDLVADEPDRIQEKLRHYCDQLRVNLVVTTGGTGMGPRDVTPEATAAVLDRVVPGIPEAMRWAGAQITGRAILSRGVAGIRARTLIVNLPGSPRGAVQSLSAVLPSLAHGLEMLRGQGHPAEQADSNEAY